MISTKHRIGMTWKFLQINISLSDFTRIKKNDAYIRLYPVPEEGYEFL
jgi:hypothetical protein